MISKEKLRKFLMEKNKGALDTMGEVEDNGQRYFIDGYSESLCEIITKLDAGEFEEEVQNEKNNLVHI